LPKKRITPPFYVLVDVKLDPNNTWNEWLSMGGFFFALHKDATAQDAARHARHIVDRKGEDKVRVSVLDPETNLYADPIQFEPIKF
jgi:hypothetical protein